MMPLLACLCLILAFILPIWLSLLRIVIGIQTFILGTPLIGFEYFYVIVVTEVVACSVPGMV